MEVVASEYAEWDDQVNNSESNQDESMQDMEVVTDFLLHSIGKVGSKW